MKFISQERRSPILLIAVLFTFLVIISGQIKEDQEKTVLENVVRKATSPLARGAYGTGRFFYSFWDRYIHLLDVDGENRRLKKELDLLKLRKMLWADEKQRLRKMEELSNMEGINVENHVLGEVVLLNISELSCIAYVNRGLKDGVRSNMNVVTSMGLVGIVKEVEDRFSKIVLIIDKSCRVAVKVMSEGSETQAILAGNRDGCFLDFMISQGEITPGDEVLTSGKDRMYIAGVPVGTVSTVAEEYTGKSRIVISPAVDFNDLDEVIIMKSVLEKPGLVFKHGGKRPQ